MPSPGNAADLMEISLQWWIISITETHSDASKVQFSLWTSISSLVYSPLSQTLNLGENIGVC